VTRCWSRVAAFAAAAASIAIVARVAVRRDAIAAEAMDVQRITVLYQNFPNPFPTPSSPATCLWFDLSAASDVTLAVYDLRGHLVRTILPSPQIEGHLAAGSYGRLLQGANAGCDPRFSWDGRGSDGHTMPPGVYLARLHAEGRWQTKKMVFRGQ
jgi:hypothetical protein